MCYVHVHVSPATGEPIRLEPTVLEDRYGCYSYDTMDERRDIRCQVRSILEEKISLAFSEISDEGPSSGPDNPNGPGGGGGPNGEGFGEGPNGDSPP